MEKRGRTQSLLDDKRCEALSTAVRASKDPRLLFLARKMQPQKAAVVDGSSAATVATAARADELEDLRQKSALCEVLAFTYALWLVVEYSVSPCLAMKSAVRLFRPAL